MIPRILGALLLCLACAAQAGLHLHRRRGQPRLHRPAAQRAQGPTRRTGAGQQRGAAGHTLSSARRAAGGEAAGLPATAHPLPRTGRNPARQQRRRHRHRHQRAGAAARPSLSPAARRQACRSAGRSPVFPLKNLDRGTHQVAVEIIDGDGMTVESTPSQPFHLHREHRRPTPAGGRYAAGQRGTAERALAELPYPLRRGRIFRFFPTLLAKTPPATSTHQIGAITRTTFYTVPISGHRSSPKTFPAHL